MMKMDQDIYDVKGLSVRARNAFNNNMCLTVGEAIEAIKTRRCLKFRNFGRMSFDECAKVFGLPDRCDNRVRCPTCHRVLPKPRE